jgi:hypothetical protein
MSKLALSFFATAALCALGGMVWGIIMAASNDHGMMPAHAHLNLMGWATLALMGTYYALSGKGGRLGWINYVLSTLGVIVAIPSLALLLAGNQAAEMGATAGSILALLGMAVFAFGVVNDWRAAPSA